MPTGDILDKLLVIIISNPNLLDRVMKDSMPNINFPTMGGAVFWNDLAENSGWRIQQDTLSSHCRILDPDNIRRAWGTLSGMEEIFERMVAATEGRKE